jgi:DNA (cytosine-5)-methyltransferase 1
MNYKDKLIELINESKNNIDYTKKLKKNTLSNIKILAEKCFVQKGVFTVFTTLSVYKILNPEQDIRKHQSQISGGFSGRTIDTQYITPVLKELGLPSMSESGWLTRSLEQPYPYTLDYNGKISNKIVKKAFLELINDIQENNIKPKYIVVELFKQIFEIQKQNLVLISPLKNSEHLTISKIISVLEKQFSFHYDSFGGSKLPVLAFYSIYKILISELKRYKDCDLKSLGSHTASDKTSKLSGDIEIYKNGKLFESIEIKLDKKIDANIVRIAREKIIMFNPNRYYILSYIGYNQDELEAIEELINKVKNEHGCQIVMNGVIPTLKYYLRLIENLDLFISNYSNLIQGDMELKSTHKKKWNDLILELNHND